MATGKKKYRILVADSGGKICDFISQILPPGDYEPILQASDAGQARRTLLTATVDMIIINAPLTDEFGTELALDLAQSSMGVLLMVKNELYDQVCSRVEDNGVLTLGKPVSRQTLYTALKLLTALSSRLARMEKQQKSLQEKMQDIRLVNRAKWLLIEHLRMREEDAHYYIEKKAMDSRLSRREVAESIIRTYE